MRHTDDAKGDTSILGARFISTGLSESDQLQMSQSGGRRRLLVGAGPLVRNPLVLFPPAKVRVASGKALKNRSLNSRCSRAYAGLESALTKSMKAFSAAGICRRLG
jgi:hypothetical protein